MTHCYSYCNIRKTVNVRNSTMLLFYSNASYFDHAIPCTQTTRGNNFLVCHRLTGDRISQKHDMKATI